MSRSGRFCPRCGDPIERAPEAAGWESDRDSALCDACYIDEYDLVDAPDRIEISVCAQCGAVHRGNRWLDVGAEDYVDVAIDEVSEALGVHVAASSVSWQVAPEQVDETTIRVHCSFSGVLRGTPVTAERVVPVKISRETCTRCGRIAGGSYASVVQLRAEGRSPTDDERDRTVELAHEVVAEMEEKGDRDAFVTEVAEVEGGVDIQLSTTQLGERVARQVVEEFGGHYTAHETLLTEDGDGNEVYRVTYAVYLVPYQPGAVIDPGDDDGPVLVENAQGNVRGRRLETGGTYRADHEDVHDADRLGAYEDGEETTLVAVVDEHAVQVLDPESYETETIARPSHLDPDAETVRVLRSRAGLHVLPTTHPGAE